MAAKGQRVCTEETLPDAASAKQATVGDTVKRGVDALSCPLEATARERDREPAPAPSERQGLREHDLEAAAEPSTTGGQCWTARRGREPSNDPERRTS